MALPPPTATKPSTSFVRAYSAASSMERSVGSTAAPSNTSALMPCSSSSARPIRKPQGGEARIGDDQNLPEPEPAGVEPDLLGGAESELDRRHLHDEDGLGR